MKIPKAKYYFEEIPLDTEQERLFYFGYLRKTFPDLAFTGDSKVSVLKGNNFYGTTFPLGLTGAVPFAPRQKGYNKLLVAKANILSAVQAQIRSGIKENSLLGCGLNLIELESVLQLFRKDVIIESTDRGLIFSDTKKNWFFFHTTGISEVMPWNFEYFHTNREMLKVFTAIEQLLTNDFIIQAKGNKLRFERIDSYYSGVFSMQLVEGTYEKIGNYLFHTSQEADYPYINRLYLKKLVRPILRRLKVSEVTIYELDSYLSIPKVTDKEKTFIDSLSMKFEGKTINKYLIYTK